MINSFYTRQHICYSAYTPRQFRPSIHPSVTRMLCVKMAERIIKILSLSDRSIILVFRHQGSLLKSDGFTPIGGTKYKGGSFYRPICSYISDTVIDRGIVSMEDEYEVVCALLNSAAFNYLQWPWNQISKSQYSLKVNISQTVHPIHSMFCSSRLGFSGIGRSNGALSGSQPPAILVDGAVARNPCVSWTFLLFFNLHYNRGILFHLIRCKLIAVLVYNQLPSWNFTAGHNHILSASTGSAGDHVSPVHNKHNIK